MTKSLTLHNPDMALLPKIGDFDFKKEREDLRADTTRSDSGDETGEEGTIPKLFSYKNYSKIILEYYYAQNIAHSSRVRKQKIKEF